MAQPVWVLSVDLQTKTATFQSGMADAARAARQSFVEIKDGAGGMASETGYRMSEARHGIRLLGEEFGIHLPRGVMAFLTSLGPVGAAMEAAFPFLAIIVGATLLIQHLMKLREEGEKLTESQAKFLVATQNAFNALDQKLLEAGIKADELNADHLGALKKQLELINRQSMDELVKSFDAVAKAADAVMGELTTKFYQFGIGSAGAQHALTQFQTQYDSLLAQGKDKEASDLLRGTRESAVHVLAAMQQVRATQAAATAGQGSSRPAGDWQRYLDAQNTLKQAGVGITEREVQAQQQLVATLNAQAKVEEKVAALKQLQRQNATQTTDNKLGDEAEREAKRQQDEEKREQEIEEKNWQEAHDRAVANLQQAEREKIAATQEGSAARLAAIDAAIQNENRYGLQETAFYKQLLTSRVEVTRQAAEEEARLAAEAGREEAEHELKMGEIQLAATKERMWLQLSTHRARTSEIISAQITAANAEYALKMSAYSREIAALDKNAKDYNNRLKAIQNQRAEATREHENLITAIKDRAEMARNQRILAAEERMQDEIARGLSSVLTRHQSFGSMLTSIGDQVAQGMIQNAIKSMMALDMTKEREAASAARKAFLTGWNFPFPINIVMAPALGAMAFASVMAFQEGGIVPGVGRGDIVPAMLEPGEGVIPKPVMDAARSGVPTESRNVQLHFRPTYHVQTIDSGGVRDMLQKHNQEFSRHFQNELRRMNR